MKRKVLSQLTEWKNRDAQHRKPLIMEGARQTGKTWLARELGRTEFQNYVEINFETDDDLQNLFELNFDIERILMTIQQAKGVPVVAGKYQRSVKRPVVLSILLNSVSLHQSAPA